MAITYDENGNAVDTSAPAATDQAVAAPAAATAPPPISASTQGMVADAVLNKGLGYAKQLAANLSKITAVAPWASQSPDFVLQVAHMASTGGNIDQILNDLQDTTTFAQLVRQRDQMVSADPASQQTLFDQMDQRTQQGLAHLGYLPPNLQPHHDRSLLQQVGHVAEDALAPVGAVATGHLGPLTLPQWATPKGIGNATLTGLKDVGNTPGYLYRVINATSAELGNSLGLKKAGPGPELNSGNFLKSVREAWNGEKFYDPNVAQQVRESFDDQANYQYTKRLAEGATAAELANEIAPRASNPQGFAVAFQNFTDFAANPLVQAGIQKLHDGKISFGRDVAASVGLSPGMSISVPGGAGTLHPYDYVSGAGDAAFSYNLDPVQIAGGAIEAGRVANSLEPAIAAQRAGGADAVFHAIGDAYTDGLDSIVSQANGAGRVVDVTHPDYMQGLRQIPGINGADRMATMISDHLTQAGDEAAPLLYQRLHDSRFVQYLADYNRSTPITSPSDVGKMFQESAGQTALVDGTLRNFKYQTVALPTLSKIGTYGLDLKINMQAAINFAAEAGPKLSRPLQPEDFAAGLPSAIERGGTMILSPMARAAQHMLSLVPATNVIGFNDPNRIELFDQFLNYGVRGADRNRLFTDFLLADTEGKQRAIMSDALDSMLGNLGLLTDPEAAASGPIAGWRAKLGQAYANNGLDLAEDGTHSAVSTSDFADAMQFPAYKDMMAEVRRQRMLKAFSGGVGSGGYNAALRVWKPVETAAENYTRFFLKPFALGFPFGTHFGIRQGLTEATEQVSRRGVGEFFRSNLIDKALKPRLDLIGADFASGDSVNGMLSKAYREGSDAAATKTAAGLRSGIVKVLGRPLTEGEIAASEEPHLIDNVMQGRSQLVHGVFDTDGARGPNPFATIETAHGAVDMMATGRYAESNASDPFYKLNVADRAARMNTDPLYRMQAAVHSAFVDETQATRIAQGLGETDNPDAFDAVKQIREGLNGMPAATKTQALALASGDWRAGLVAAADNVRQPQLAQALRYAARRDLVDGRAITSLDDVIPGIEDTLGKVGNTRARNAMLNSPAMVAARSGDLSALLGDIPAGDPRVRGWLSKMAELSPSDRQAALFDPSAVLSHVAEDGQQAHWAHLLEQAQRGDTDAVKRLANEMFVARAQEPDLAAVMRRADRMGPKFGVGPGVDSPEMARARAALDRAKEAAGLAAADHSGTTIAEAKTAYTAAQVADAQRSVDLITSSKSPVEGLEQWAPVHGDAFRQIALDSDGHVIHGITAPMADGSLNTWTHIMNADIPLPAQSIGPVLRVSSEPSLYQRMLNNFYDTGQKIVGGMSRNALFHATYAQNWDMANPVIGDLVRNPELASAAKDVLGGASIKDASDVMLKLRHKITEGYQVGAHEMRDVADLPDSDLADILNANLHGIGPGPESPFFDAAGDLAADVSKAGPITEANVPAIKAWWANEQNAREAVSNATMNKTVREMTPFIHSASVRSQASDVARLTAPFMFATEQFYKRWARTLVQSPEAIRRLQLIHHSMSASGFLDHDQYGNEVLHYPGAGLVNNTLDRFFNLFPFSKTFTVPVMSGLTTELTKMTPGFSDAGSWPRTSPLVTVPMEVLRHLAPEMARPMVNSIASASEGGYTQQGLLSQILPANVKSVYDLTSGWDDGSHAGSSLLGAMQMLEASGHGIPESTTDPTTGVITPVTTAQKDDYLSRLRTTARIMGVTRVMFGLVGPAAPTIVTDPQQLAKEYSDLISAGVPIGEATADFLKAHPDAKPYTTFATESPGKAPSNDVQASLDVLTSHDAFFKKYADAGAWLLPQQPAGAPGAFSIQAYRQELADGIRVKKSPTQIWTDLKYAEAAPTFFATKDDLDAALAAAAGNTQQTQALNDAWRSWSQNYLAAHPVFADQYASPAGKQQRDATRKELASALDDPEAPTVAHAPALRTMLNTYNDLTNEVGNSMSIHTTAAVQYRKDLKEAFANWATAFSAANPTVEAFYLRNIRPDLGLPSDVTATATTTTGTGG